MQNAKECCKRMLDVDKAKTSEVYSPSVEMVNNRRKQAGSNKVLYSVHMQPGTNCTCPCS